MSSNFYEVLGIDADASSEDIRKAYRKRALQTHPDRLPQGATAADKQAAEEQFRKVNNAYEILMDTKNRKLYDLYGVWPPPQEFPEEPQRERRSHSGHPSSHRPYPDSDPFNHPFFASRSPFGDPFLHHRHPRPFAYRDPFDLFNAMFADLERNTFQTPTFMPGMHGFDSFPRGPSSMFDHSHPFLAPSPFTPFSALSAFPDLLDAPDDRRRDPSQQNGMRTFSFQSSSHGRYAPGHDDQGPQWVSESKMVRSVNGVTQTIYKKEDRHGNVHVRKVYPDGREKYTVNGVEQPQSGHIQDVPPSNRLPSPPMDPAYIPPPPIIPPDPEGISKTHWWSRR